MHYNIFQSVDNSSKDGDRHISIFFNKDMGGGLRIRTQPYPWRVARFLLLMQIDLFLPHLPAGVSINRYLGRTLPRKNSHFSWFYKKLGPFYKKLNFEWQSIFQHCMSSGWLTYTGIWSGGFIVFKVMTHRESMYFFQYFPYRIDHIC